MGNWIAGRSKHPQQTGNERARATFTALLETGTNSLRIIAEDATGNRDTTYMVVLVANTPVIKKLTSSPNPFQDQAVVTFIAGIALLDATLVAMQQQHGLALLCIAGFALTLLLQRWVRGT